MLIGSVEAKLLRGPYVQNVTQRSVVIVWTTDNQGTSNIEYGLTTALGSSVATNRASAIPLLPDLDDCYPGGNIEYFRYDATLTGLNPGTKYYYQAKTNGVQLNAIAEEFTFKTAPTASDSSFNEVTFVALGDSGSGSWAQGRRAEQIKGINPSFIIHTGDVVYNDGRDDEYNNGYFLPYQSLIRRIPVFPTLGNHDYYDGRNGQTYCPPGSEIQCRYLGDGRFNFYLLAQNTGRKYILIAEGPGCSVRVDDILINSRGTRDLGDIVCQ